MCPNCAVLEAEISIYWDAAKHAEELLAMVYEKLRYGKTYEALKLLEQGGE